LNEPSDDFDIFISIAAHCNRRPMIAGLAALLGGVVVFGSNTSTANQLSESMRSAEAQRAALIGQLDIRLVEDAPANRPS
jgi:hypothetical protein